MDAKDDKKLEKAVFAGGCFWCMEAPFEAQDGVINVVAGYSGETKNPRPTRRYPAGETGTSWNQSRLPWLSPYRILRKLLEIFWRNIDPTDSGGSLTTGASNTARPYSTKTRRKSALPKQSKKGLEDSGVFDKPIVTEILPFKAFYLAEEYHQDYHKKNPVRYKFYRSRSGRDNFLKKDMG